MRPPRNTPSASSASTVTTVPAFTTTHGGGKSSLRQRAPARGDQQRPAVGAELRGRPIAVDDAAAALRRDEPFDGEAPARELALDAHARRLAARR